MFDLYCFFKGKNVENKPAEQSAPQNVVIPGNDSITVGKWNYKDNV